MNEVKSIHSNENVYLSDLLLIVWRKRIVVLVSTIISAIFSIVVALNLSNIYRSEALLAPVADDAGLNISGQLGGLAALAGVNLGGNASDKVGLALEILKSRHFLGNFIERHDLYVPLMAAKGWSRSDNKLVLDEKLYDLENEKWRREVKPPLSAKPSIYESREKLLELMKVSRDKTSGMVTLSVEHYSPFIAQQWVKLLVFDLNNEMRERELVEAQNSINYLNAQIEKTNIADVRTLLFSLIEEQTKTLMLANVREEYILKTIDPPVVAEKKAKPARALIVILGTLLGSMLSVAFVLIRYFASSKE